MLTRLALLLLVALSVALAQPGGGASPLPIVEVQARWNVSSARDLPSLIEATGTVFTGEVLAKAGQTAAPAPQEGPAGFPISRFEVRVLGAVAGGVRPGEFVTVEQPGGEVEQDGRRAVAVLEGDSPLEPGATYLFFARLKDNGAYSSPPFGRFKIAEDGRFQAAVAWADLGAVRAVGGIVSAAPENEPLAAGAPQKKLLPYTWYQQLLGNDYTAWMTLSASDVVLNCGTGQDDCGSRWNGPFQAAVADWNAQDTTARLAYNDGDHSLLYDVNVIVNDEARDDPFLFGVARFFDSSYNECFFSCTTYFGWAEIGDASHTEGWGTSGERQVTISHEIGHLLGLAHESVGPGESTKYPCGYDDTGPIPHSVMSYNCVDPIDRHGLTEITVQPFDVCGVNHKYPDPTVGLAGCDGLAGHDPEEPRGDLDCDKDIDSADGLRGLRFVAGLDPGVPAGCAELGAYSLARAGFAGDLDCDNDTDAGDALLGLRFVAGLPSTVESWCPEPG